MRRLITADLWRICRKRSLWIVTVLFLIIYAAFTWYSLDKGLDKGLAFAKVSSEMGSTFALFLGFVLLGGVYSDEYRNMTMIATIGRGISRRKYVSAKFLDSLLLAVLCFIVFSAFTAVLQLVFSVSLSSRELLFIALAFITSVFSLISCMTIASIAYYLTDSIVLGVIAFLTFNVIVPVALQFATLIPFVARFRPNLYSIEGVVSRVRTAFIMGTYGHGILLSIAGIAVYIVAVLIISMIVFEKKELDF